MLPSGRKPRLPTHPGPTSWNFRRTDLAKLLIFYKDLNQRSIMESPANSVSSRLVQHVPDASICLSVRSRGTVTEGI